MKSARYFLHLAGDYKHQAVLLPRLSDFLTKSPYLTIPWTADFDYQPLFFNLFLAKLCFRM